MAYRTFYPLMTIGTEVKTLSGSFQCNGVSAPLLQAGSGFSVTRTGVGAYLITLTDKYTSLQAAIANLQLNAASNLDVQFGAIDVVTAATAALSIINLNTGAATEVAANANNRVSFTLFVKNSALK